MKILFFTIFLLLKLNNSFNYDFCGIQEKDIIKKGKCSISSNNSLEFIDSTMLSGNWVPSNPHSIDFENLPKVKHKHTIVSDVRNVNGVNQHNYITYYNNKYWIMWSDGPGVEDKVGQRVAYSTSFDGINWSNKKYITPFPPISDTTSAFYNTRSDFGYRFIARGFWKRGSELIALVAFDEANNFFGPSLKLLSFKYNITNNTWQGNGIIYNNAINNFPPKLLPNNKWMMTRRSYDRNVFMLIGGVNHISDWKSYPVVTYDDKSLRAEEPYWWVSPNKDLIALFRDNNKSGYLFRAISKNNGITWSKPIKTNFPDASSKFNGLCLKDGRYLLVSNPNPKKRDPLVLSISNDGIIFTKMIYLIGGRRVDYPHLIEQDGSLLIAFSGGKQSVEVIKIEISELDKVKMPTCKVQK
jgi:BNR repeat-like domain